MNFLSLLPWIGIFVAGMAYVFIQNRRTTLQDNESYFFANRSLNVWLLTSTLLATQVGGGMLVGVCDTAYQSGLMGFFYPISQMIGLVVIVTFFSRAFQHSKLQTAPEIFTKIYDAPFLRKCSSILSTISLFIILIAQVVAIRKLLTSIGIDQEWVLIIIWGIVVAYTAFGGFGIVVKTDVIQITLVFVGMGFVYFSAPELSLVLLKNQQSTITALNWLNGINLLIWPCCYMLIEQDMVQRYVSAKSQQNLNRALWLTCVGLLLAALVPVMIGLVAQQQMLSVSNTESVLLSYTKNLSLSWVYSLTAFVILMAIISTVDSILCALGSLIAIDNLLPIKIKTSYQKNSLITVMIGISAFIGAYFASSVLGTLVFSYGITASALCVPMVMALLRKTPCSFAAQSAFWSGLFGYVLLMILIPTYSFAAIFISFIGFFLGEYFVSVRLARQIC